MERSKPRVATLLVGSALLQGCVGVQAGDGPVDDRAVTTGPSSRTRVRVTSNPSASDDPYLC